MNGPYQDKVLQCVECGAEFVFTAGEQLFFAEKNFQHEPKRCKDCKAQRHSRVSESRLPQTETVTTCFQCGREATVPFRPTRGRPVYCRDCFQQRRVSSSSSL